MKKLFLILVMLVAMNASGQWQPDVRLTNSPGSSYKSHNNTWCIAANGNIIHIVWFDDRDGNKEIYYKRSTDGGIIWGADTRLTNNTAWSEQPSIIVSGSNVHIIWYDYRDGNYEIYYKGSTDGGINWGADTRLTNNIASSGYPSIAAVGNLLHLVWYDYRDSNSEIYYKRSTNAGLTWGADTRLTNNSALSGIPSVAVFNSNVHIVWPDYRNDDSEIYYKHSTDGGLTWGEDTRLTNDSAISTDPSIAVNGSLVNIVWSDSRDFNYEIYNKRSTDNGITWGADTRLTNAIYHSEYPSIAVSGSNMHLVWQDYRDNDHEIYYKYSTNSGITWGMDTRLTNNNAQSWKPSITYSGSVVHVIWQDQRDGNDEIYYKRNPTGNPVGINNISSEIPSSYSLSQNYPNPFNPTTNIKFSIVNSGNVKLVVYDIQGRELQTLVNESLKPGTYEVNFDGSKLTSGVYFYKLITDSYSETKKMCLIK